MIEQACTPIAPVAGDKISAVFAMRMFSKLHIQREPPRRHRRRLGRRRSPSSHEDLIEHDDNVQRIHAHSVESIV